MSSKLISFRTTRLAVIWTHFLNEPLQVLYTFIPFILYRDLGASAFQIALLTTLKPLVTILSFYWSAGLARRPEKLLTNILLTGFLTRLPFLLFPFVSNSWFVIGSAALYMMLSRGGLPSWMEVVKQNVPEEKRGKLFSYSMGFSYLEGIFLSLGMAAMLDHATDSWKWLFPATSVIGLAGLAFQAKIPMKAVETGEIAVTNSWTNHLVSPWKESLEILKKKDDFRLFQWGFMWAGGALMLIQPALPLFFVDYLNCTYTEVALALSVCKGLGFAISSPFWADKISPTHIFRSSASVFLAVSLFFVLLVLALVHPYFLYLAYFCYGIGQAGSHLVWHLSGTIFAEKEDSAPYTNVNLLAVGLRGAVAPPLGSVISLLLGPVSAFAVSSIVCLMTGMRLLRRSLPAKASI
jgi:hypothetical protein